MDAIYFTLLFKALVMGGRNINISMIPPVQKYHQAVASTQMLLSAAPCIWNNCPCYELTERKGATLILENFVSHSLKTTLWSYMSQSPDS